MRLMVIGSGGREHAIIKSLRKSAEIDEIYCLPGNGGIAQDATCVDIAPTDIENIVKFGQSENIDYAVVAMDDPLALGCVDKLEEVGIPCFGPKANAAIIESSKVFSKNLMKKYNIPTAEYETFSRAEEALNFIESAPLPTVIKADGLALGKGVIIAQTKEEGAEVIPVMSFDAYNIDSKFGKAKKFVEQIETITQKNVIHTKKQVEEIENFNEIKDTQNSEKESQLTYPPK